MEIVLVAVTSIQIKIILFKGSENDISLALDTYTFSWSFFELKDFKRLS